MSKPIEPSGAPQHALSIPNQRLTLARLKRLTQKEMREILRDRRTIVTLILMPLLVYPMLSLAFHRYLLTSLPSKSEETLLVIGVPSNDVKLMMDGVLFEGDRLLRERDEGGGKAEPSTTTLVRWDRLDDVKQGVAEMYVDVGVVLTRADSNSAASSLSFELIHRPSSENSSAALDYITARLDAVNQAYVKRKFQQFGAEMRPPAIFAVTSVKQPADAQVSLATVVPLILILMTITGAVYPAIDLTAGERERGTLETLVAAPVPRLGLLLAKYFAVLVVALLTATVNLVAMAATVLLSGLGPALFGDQFSFLVVAQIFGLLILFAAFFSAVLLILTSMARSFKEAQAYLVPLMLMSLGPGILGVIPGIEFTGILAVTPLVNIVLLSREMLNDQVDPTLATMAVLSTAVYTLAAIALAAKVFGGDAVLYGSAGSWRDLFRQPQEPQTAPSIAAAMGCLALVFPSYFVLSSALTQADWLPMSARIALAGGATALLFGVIPIAAALLYRVRLRDGFLVHAPHLAAVLGALILGASVWPFAHEIVVFAQQLGIGSLSLEQFEAVQKMLETWRTLSPLLILLTFALTPAVFEELFFRGYLFSALQKRLSPAKTILISAALFGVFHVVSGNVLAVERLLPSTFLGLVLGAVCHRCRSVIPSILLHATHNGLLLMVAYYRDQLATAGLGVEESKHLPATWLAAALLAATFGWLIIWLSSRNAAARFAEAEAVRA